MSPIASAYRVQRSSPLTDESARDWRPAAISDRKLLKLHRQLVKVQALGDAFADVSFSPEMTDRLRQIHQDRGEA